ncbi:MAG TPA: porin family protein [Gammaproteobacteria bacterium]|nr:porin family protein [Gammaproteobacteria bacterium]
MDKRFISLLAFSLAAVPTLAAADDSGWYAAADLGRAHYSEGDLTPSGLCSFPPFCTTFSNVKLNDRGYRLSGGYQFDDHWGVEAGYADFGTASETVFVRYPVAFFNDRKFKAHGWTVGGTGTWSWDNSWSLTGRLGLIRATMETDIEGTLCPASGCSFSATTATDWRWTLGGSLNWILAEDWMLRLNFDHYRRLGETNVTGQFSVNLITFGAVYRFR